MGYGLKILCMLLAIFLLITSGIVDIVTGNDLWDTDSAEAQLRQSYSVDFLKSTGNHGQLLAQVALNEYEAGQEKAGVGHKYYGHWGHQVEQWCCDFVYYCADMCGYVDGTENTGDYPVFGDFTAWTVLAWKQLIEQGGEAFTVWDQTMKPQAGDIVFYYKTDSGSAASTLQTWCTDIIHVAIVVENNGGYSITTIEGNVTNDIPGNPDTSRVRKVTWADTRGVMWEGACVYGFVRPNYPVRETTLIGDLSRPFYYEISEPDLSYTGHPVLNLTDAQIAEIKNTLYGEFGIDLAGAIAVAQSIRDNVDRSPSITYDNFVTSCKYYGGYEKRTEEVYSTEIVNTAFEYVFLQGGSAIQHPIYVFYAPVPEDGLSTDADFQALFVAQLDFVLEVSPARFFSWEIAGSKDSAEGDSGAYLKTYRDASTGDYLDYYLFLPENVVENMPLIIFLHGDGEVGQVDKLKNYGMISQAKKIYGNSFPFISISPCTRSYSWVDGTIPTTLMGLIDSVVDTYSINENKIIITGHSRGATGVWHMISNYGSFFSAAVPVSNYNQYALNYENCAEVPIWAFAGNVGESELTSGGKMRKQVDYINATGGNAMFSTLSGSHGDMKTVAYSKEVFEWMLAK